jgi:integrase
MSIVPAASGTPAGASSRATWGASGSSTAGSGCGCPHRFRHDPARRLVERADLPTVAVLLGHCRVDTVRIHSQPGPDELARGAAVPEEG